MLDKISNHIENPISGDWGNDVDEKTDNFTFVLRTTNFTNIGKVNYTNVVKRDIFSFVVDRKRLKKNDIIIEKSGGSDKIPVGRVVFFDIDEDNYMCNNFTSILRCKDTLNSKYLFYYLFRNHKRRITVSYQNKTTGIRNLQLKKYLNTTIPIPPLPQQEKIVKVLDISSQLIEKQKELIADYNLFLKSKFIEMFGDPIKNPMGWEVVKFLTIANIKTTSIKAENITNEIYIALDSIEKETGKLVEAYSSDDVDIKSNKYIFTSDMLLYGKLRPYLNKVLLPNFDGICSTDILPIEPIEKVSTKQYIAYYLRHSKIVELLSNSVSGANLPRVSPKILKNLNIQKIPIEQQEKFASIVKQIDTIKTKETQKLEHLETLHKSLMDKAFKGEIK